MPSASSLVSFMIKFFFFSFPLETAEPFTALVSPVLVWKKLPFAQHVLLSRCLTVALSSLKR